MPNKEYKMQEVAYVEPPVIDTVPGITAPQLNYSTSVGGAEAPEPGADKTSANIAAGIVGQGSLATKSSVTDTEIVNRSISSIKLALATIQADVIAAGAITENKLYTGAVTADKIAANAVTSAKINAGAVTAGKIAAGSVTATEINVSQLSAISANIGTITSGTITGATLQTSSSSNTGIKMSSGIGGMEVYGENIKIYNTSGTQYGTIGSGGAYFDLQSISNRNIRISPWGGSVYFGLNSGSGIAPLTNSQGNCGLSSQLWANVYTQNVDFGSSCYLNRSGTVFGINGFTNLSIGGYTFRPVGFTFKDGSGNNKYLIVLATADPV